MTNIDDSKFVVDDGGLSKSKMKDLRPANDCVVRALAIATGEPYDNIAEKVEEARAAFVKDLKKKNPGAPISDKPTDLNEGVPGDIAANAAKELGWLHLWGFTVAGETKAALRHFLLPNKNFIAIIVPELAGGSDSDFWPMSSRSPHWVAIKSGRVHDVEKFCVQGERVLNIGVMAIFGREEDAAMVKEIAENPSNLPVPQQGR